MTGKRI